MIYIPYNKLYQGIALQYKSWMLSISNQYVGFRYINPENKGDHLNPYNIINAYISKQIYLKQHTFECNIGVYNIADEQYEAIRYYPMPLRNYKLSLSYKFKKN